MNHCCLKVFKSVTTISGAALVAFGAHASQAATLSLTPLTSEVGVNSTVTYDVILTGADNVFAYDFNVDLSSTDLQFVGTAPFTNLDSAQFSALPYDALNSPTDFEASYAIAGGDPYVTSATPITLGSFEVTNDGATPLSVNTITFGPDSESGPAGGSEVDDSSGNNDLVGPSATTGAIETTVAPEPSQIGMIALMAIGLGGLMLRARRKMSAVKGK